MSFQPHVELLQFFLARRDDIVERIQDALNAQRKPVEDLQDHALLSRRFEDCCFTLPGLTHDQSRLRGQLDEAHRASGFKPRELPGLYNGLADPAEMMTRAFHLWRLTRWPGRGGRVHYAHTLFNLYVIRCLELLSLRLWDDGSSSTAARLSQLQGVLDALWTSTPAEQPVLVRDARWLVPLAQSPATDDLGAYFDMAEKIAASFSPRDRLEIHKAGVHMTGGHLRSQIRYYATKKAVSFDDASVTLVTRTSNALDFALLIQDLVPLLEAYEDACNSADARRRIDLAGAVCQGLSPDPELFLNRLDLLGAYSMVEHLFVTTDPAGQVVYTPTGQRHVRLLQEYQSRIARTAGPLHEDCPRFRPAAGAYSPYGVLYGFSSHLLEHMVLKALQPDAVTRFSLEDVFVDGDAGADRLAWVTGWRKLPHVTKEVEALFEYPQQFAEDVFARIEQALRRRVSGETPQTGRLHVVPAEIADLPPQYIASSDRQLVAAGKAEYRDEPQISSDRREGRCVVSYKTPGGSVAISKAMLTEVLGAGRDANVALPPAAAEALALMCPRLVM